MARFIEELTPEQEQEFKKWLAERPPSIRAMAERIKPGHLYKHKISGHRMFPVSYQENEDGSCTILTMGVSGKFNRVVFERKVFGIKPEDLEECDLPSAGEELGCKFDEAGFSEEERERVLDEIGRKIRKARGLE